LLAPVGVLEQQRCEQPPLPGIGQLVAAVSATGRFGDGGRKCFMRKKCMFLKYFEGSTTKDVC